MIDKFLKYEYKFENPFGKVHFSKLKWVHFGIFNSSKLVQNLSSIAWLITFIIVTYYKLINEGLIKRTVKLNVSADISPFDTIILGLSGKF